MTLASIYQRIIFVRNVSKDITHLIVFLILLITVKGALKRKISFAMEEIFYIQKKGIGDLSNLPHLLNVQIKLLALVEPIMMIFSR